MEEYKLLKRSLPFSDADNNENKFAPMQSSTETGGGKLIAKRSLISPNEQVQLEKVDGSLDTVNLIASASIPSSNSVARRFRSRIKSHDEDNFLNLT